MVATIGDEGPLSILAIPTAGMTYAGQLANDARDDAFQGMPAVKL